MNEEKIKEVFSDKEFVKSLMELDTPEEVQKALTEKDIDLSTEEIKKIAELLRKKAEGELTDEDLENVAGGMGIIGIMGIVTVVAAAVEGTISLINTAVRRRW